MNQGFFETIYAVASGHGVAGVAVIRIAGNKSTNALKLLINSDLPEPRMAKLCRLFHPQSKAHLDDALVLRFKAPASFTGEDVVELHIHGGLAVTESVLEALAGVDGLRPAMAGEFTRRAFENGKLDLTQVEGLADLIHAQTKAQHRQALRQAEGALGKLYDNWRQRLIEALAYFEAELDFSDEELPEHLLKTVQDKIHELQQQISSHLGQGQFGERLREGVRLAIVGPPNAGKSTLLNALALREAAIVSDMAGTTRDVVEVHLNLGGYPVLIADTAGLRDTTSAIEQEGVRRAQAWAEHADLIVALFDGAKDPKTDPIFDAQTVKLLDDRCIVCVNKADQAAQQTPTNFQDIPVLSLSVKNGQGMEALLNQLTVRVANLCKSSGEDPIPTRRRHIEALKRAEKALVRFLAPDHQATAFNAELKAEDLRMAARELGRITGRVDVEELLDVIFRDFCIGK